MALEDTFHEEMLSLFRRTGEATGYWPNYFHRDVQRNGGLVVAKKLLAPGTVSSGFDRLNEVRRADLSVEYIALSDAFSSLFTEEELEVARRRLATLPPDSFPARAAEPKQFFEEPSDAATFAEGAVDRVPVNRYERNPAARAACIAHHGSTCLVCGFDFERCYGEIGNGFIHVHHKRLLSKLKSTYQVDPVKDMVPVCANCHAMLHRREPPLDVQQLQRMLRE